MPLKDTEDLIYRLTDPIIVSHEPEQEDELVKAIQIDAAVLAHSLKYLAHKVQSPCERESLAALDVLDIVVKRGGRTVHAEVGKFRFLNELIKVVSPKYLGERSSDNVKKKTTAILFMWSQAVRYEQKIVEAYNMLKQQGIVRDDPPVPDTIPPPPPRPKNPIIEDDEKAKLLRRLLQSKEPADMVAANRLIKSMVREDDQRTEKIVRRHSDLTQVKENAKVLSDMLRHYSTEGSTQQEREIMRQLFGQCESHRPKVFKLAAEIAESSHETDEGPNLADILSTSDELTDVIQQYRAQGLTAERFDGSIPSPQPGVELVTLDASDQDNRAASPGAGTSGTINALPPTAPKEDVMNLLDDIFTAHDATNLGGVPLLEPLTGRGNLAAAISSQTIVRNEPKIAVEPPAVLTSIPQRRNLVDFDDVTNSFLGGLTLGDKAARGKGFPVESKSRPSLNELQRLPGPEDSALQNRHLSRLSSSGDDEMLSDKSIKSDGPQNGLPGAGSLDGVTINLSDVRPATTAPIVFYQRNQLNIALYLAENKPRSDCVVFIAAVSSQNTVPVRAFTLDFSGARSTIVKASLPVTDIPAFNPVFPAGPLSTVVIVSKASNDSFNLRYSVSYELGSQSVSDSGFVDVPDAGKS